MAKQTEKLTKTAKAVCLSCKLREVMCIMYNSVDSNELFYFFRHIYSTRCGYCFYSFHMLAVWVWDLTTLECLGDDNYSSFKPIPKLILSLLCAMYSLLFGLLFKVSFERNKFITSSSHCGTIVKKSWKKRSDLIAFLSCLQLNAKVSHAED